MPNNDISHATQDELDHLWEHVTDLETEVFGPAEDTQEEDTEEVTAFAMPAVAAEEPTTTTRRRRRKEPEPEVEEATVEEE